MTDSGKILHKFCQRKMTDFVRLTVLVIPLAVNLMPANQNGRIRFTMNDI